MKRIWVLIKTYGMVTRNEIVETVRAKIYLALIYCRMSEYFVRITSKKLLS